MQTKIQEKQSKARRIKLLLKKYDKTFKAHMEMSNFKEPVVFLMKRNRKVEFYENATQGSFKFERTDGREGNIELAPEFLHTFDYGKRTFKGYLCHEDYLTPLPESPVIMADMFNIAQEKTLHDVRKWKKDEQAGIGLKWKQILIGIAILVAIPLGAKIIGGLFGVEIDLWPVMIVTGKH